MIVDHGDRLVILLSVVAILYVVYEVERFPTEFILSRCEGLKISKCGRMFFEAQADLCAHCNCP